MVVPKSSDWCPYKKKESSHRDVMVEAGIAIGSYKPRRPKDLSAVLSSLGFGTLLWWPQDTEAQRVLSSNLGLEVTETAAGKTGCPHS